MVKAYEEKIKKLFQDETFVKKFEALEEIEKIGDLFKEYNADLTDEEITDFLKAAIEAKQTTELDENDLDNVSGGVSWAAVGVVWQFAVDYWGGPKQAVQATYNFWHGVVTGKR